MRPSSYWASPPTPPRATDPSWSCGRRPCSAATCRSSRRRSWRSTWSSKFVTKVKENKGRVVLMRCLFTSRCLLLPVAFFLGCCLALGADKAEKGGTAPIKVVKVERKEPLAYEKDVEPIF